MPRRSPTATISSAGSVSSIERRLQPSVNYSADRLKSEYEERRHIREALAAIASEYSVHGRRVVELGSGLGFNLEVFSKSNQVLGIEGLESAAAIARERGIPTIAGNLGERLPLEDASCDLVLCLDVLEHLMEPEFALEEAKRILRPDGMLVINVPNHFTLSGRLHILLGSGIDCLRFFPESQDWNNPHVRFFRRASIAALLEHSGFETVGDWSPQFPSIPLFQRLGWTHSRLGKGLARRYPDLFAGGFFLLTRPKN